MTGGTDVCLILLTGVAETPSRQPVSLCGATFSRAELVDGAKVNDKKFEVVNSCMGTAVIIIHCGFSSVHLAEGGRS